MNNDYELICRAVEQSVGYSPRTPKDFDRLSDDIFARLHQKVSPTTLKRLWGYVATDSLPRQSTLDLLAQFVGCDDYLALFGIQADDTLWGQRLPHHPYISVWSPQWRHWRWHNDGDSARLLPTITEHWEPDDGSADSTLVAVRNNDHYLAQRDLNELRITFVRGLTPDGDSLTFCGVYRMDMSLSNFHHVTWRRVADRIDLEHLDYLEQLRN